MMDEQWGRSFARDAEKKKSNSQSCGQFLYFMVKDKQETLRQEKVHEGRQTPSAKQVRLELRWETCAT